MADSILADLEAWRAARPLALLVFTTPDCGVCNALKPRVAELGERYPMLAVRYVDVDANPQAAGQYGVFAVPVFLLFVQAKESLRLARHFSMRDLEEPVARYAAMLS